MPALSHNRPHLMVSRGAAERNGLLQDAAEHRRPWVAAVTISQAPQPGRSMLEANSNGEVFTDDASAGFDEGIVRM